MCRALCSTLLPPLGIQAAPQVTVLCMLRRRPRGKLGHARRSVILLRRVCTCTRARSKVHRVRCSVSQQEVTGITLC